ncbi:hypothetical protein Tco_0903662 [Tanacetum coccineum]
MRKIEEDARRLANICKFILIVAASSVGEELFYRAAIQGALADVFVRGNDLVVNRHRMAAPLNSRDLVLLLQPLRHSHLDTFSVEVKKQATSSIYLGIQDSSLTHRLDESYKMDGHDTILLLYTTTESTNIICIQMAPEGGVCKDVIESHLKTLKYDVATTKTDKNITRMATGVSGKHGMQSTNGVHELLECHVCSTPMYPLIRQFELPSGVVLVKRCGYLLWITYLNPPNTW